MSDRVMQLLQELKSEDESVLRLAVEDLGDLRDPRAIEPVANLLSDSSAAVRETVVQSLSSIGGAPTIGAMLSALRSEAAPVRNAACLVLQNLGAEAAEYIAALLQDADKDVRKFAVDVLAMIGDKSAAGVLVDVLHDENVNVAAAAADALGQLKAESAVGPMINALRASGWMRCSVARSLGKIGGAEGAKALIRLLGDQDEMVLYTAVQALGLAGDEAALEHLFSFLSHHNQMIVKAAVGTIEHIIEGLDPRVWNKVRGEIPLGPVMKLTRDLQRAVRCSAIALLGRMGTGVDALATCLTAVENEEEPVIRGLACQAILANPPRGIQPVLDALAQPDLQPEIRCEIVDLLRQLHRPEAFESLAGLLAHGDDSVRQAAAQALPDIPHPGTADVLGGLTYHPQAELRAIAARGLSALSNTTTSSLLASLLSDESDLVRQAAASGLAAVGGPMSAPVICQLIQRTDDPSPEVCEAAMRALAAAQSDTALEALASMAANDHDRSRVMAIRILSELPGSVRVDLSIYSAVEDGNPAVCVAALQGLASRNAVEVKPGILAALEQEDSAVRVAAANLLARQQPGPWTHQIIRHFETDPDVQVRYACAAAIGRLKMPGGVQSVIASLADSRRNPLVILGALEALCQIRDERARAALEQWAAEDDPEIADAANRALAELGPAMCEIMSN